MMYIISVVFGACCALIELIAEVFGWTYKEACVYVNLYLQYGVLMLSSMSVCCVAVRKMIQGFSVSRLLVLIATILYNVPFVWLGVWLWNRYGVISAEAAFDLCVDMVRGEVRGREVFLSAGGSLITRPHYGYYFVRPL